MGDFFKSLITASDHRVDTPTVCGIMLVITYTGLSTYSVIMRTDHMFDMLNFATGAAAIVGSLAAHGFFYRSQQPGGSLTGSTNIPNEQNTGVPNGN